VAGRPYSLPRLQQALRALALLAQRGDDGATREEVARIAMPSGELDSAVDAVLGGLEASQLVEVAGVEGAETFRLRNTNIAVTLESPLEVQALCSLGLLLPEMAAHHEALRAAQHRSTTALGASVSVDGSPPAALDAVRAASDSGRRATFGYQSSSDHEPEVRIGWIEDCRLSDGEWRFDLITDVRHRLRVDRIVGEVELESTSTPAPEVPRVDDSSVTVVVRCHRDDLGEFAAFGPDVRLEADGRAHVTLGIYRPEVRLGRILLGCVHPVEVVSPGELAGCQRSAALKVLNGYRLPGERP